MLIIALTEIRGYSSRQVVKLNTITIANELRK